MTFTASKSSIPEYPCPDITVYWRIAKLRRSGQRVLVAKNAILRHAIAPPESYALQYFTGEFTTRQVQKYCEQKFRDLPPDFVVQLLDRLVDLGVIVEQSLIPPNPSLEGSSILPNPSLERSSIPPNPPLEGGERGKQQPTFKSCVQWIEHPEGYWILRNPEDVTYLQIDRDTGEAIAHLGKMPAEAIAQTYPIDPAQLNYILQILAATGMLEGTHPPKPPKKKFTPLQLLYFKVPLFNPDCWLHAPAQFLNWIWTKPFFLLLLGFLATSLVFALNLRSQILYEGGILWQTQGALLIVPFGLLAMLVVTIHEFAHALTLKHYGGIVPEIGLLFMLLMPAAYTNTSDSYCLVKRRQRALVVGAGVLCQLTIGAIAFWLWHFSVDNSWLKPISYLLMVAALFTVTLNLNPMAKFDGYHLAVALTGINNLRDRSFKFYVTLLQGKGIEERSQDCGILAIYAPLSLLYLLFVFGSILRLVIYWTLDHAPITAFLLLLAWLIYFFFPREE
ncbi:MAG: M50 family metallopeptidase [Cyanobacteria bacterium P01_E01_bin.42]